MAKLTKHDKQLKADKALHDDLLKLEQRAERLDDKHWQNMATLDRALWNRLREDIRRLRLNYGTYEEKNKPL